MIAGQIDSNEVVGANCPNVTATTFVRTREQSIAALLALGIWPFSPEAFGVSDVDGATDEIGAVEKITKEVLGVTL